DYRIADARMLLRDPEQLAASIGDAYPVGAHISQVHGASFEGYIVVQREVGCEPRTTELLVHSDQTFDECVKHYKGIARQVTVETPDRYLNKGMEALCLAMDAGWHHPTFMHGAWSWHEPYLGWRGWYGGEVMGEHDRVRTAIRAHAATQIKEPETIQPTWKGRHGYPSGLDSKGGVPSMLSGEITHVFYNMVEVYLDQLFYHDQWTGDLDFMREVFPVIRDALDWERRTFDADDDGLYENWLNTWISDAHWYNGGGCIQSSAYNYRANRMAAEAAERLGLDPARFRKQAEKIKRAADEVLWFPNKGVYAEYKDALGLKRLHESPELPSLYHPIECYLADEFQAYQMLRFTEYGLKNEYKTPRGGRLIWSSAWEPPLYSSRGLYPQEVLNTLLCYYRICQVEKAQELLNGCAASWYMGPVPGGVAHNIRPNGEHFGSTDFTDTVSPFCRCIVEGLFGISPHMQDHRVTIAPGFPRRWTRAKIRTPDVSYQYERKGLRETVRIVTSRPTRKVLKMIAKWDGIRGVWLDGHAVDFEVLPGIGHACVVAEAPVCEAAAFEIRYRRIPSARILFPPVAALGERYSVCVEGGRIREFKDPQGVLQGPRMDAHHLEGEVAAAPGHHTFFVSVESGDVSRWEPADVEVRPPVEVVQPALVCSGSEATGSFRIQSHLSRPIKEDFLARFADGELGERVEVAAYGTSTPFFCPAHALGSLSPGQNPIEVSFGGRANNQSPLPAASAVITCWDLLEKRPELVESLSSRFCPIPLDDWYNDHLEEIHQHEFLSPRPSTFSIMTTVKGRPMWDGNLWGYGKPPIIDDSNLRGTIDSDGLYGTKVGVPFRQVVEGRNVSVVSLWDNFPTSMILPIHRRARKLYLLIAGTTHPMQSQIENGRITVRYADGTEQALELINPKNFDDLISAPCHHEGATEIIGNNTHAIVLDMVLCSDKVVEELEVRALSNEVLVGLLGVTLLVA
ncbi:MAG: hypothetical protein V1800_14155, partial [Candidatus Latescibacterota bacterium]